MAGFEILDIREFHRVGKGGVLCSEKLSWLFLQQNRTAIPPLHAKRGARQDPRWVYSVNVVGKFQGGRGELFTRSRYPGSLAKCSSEGKQRIITKVSTLKVERRWD